MEQQQLAIPENAGVTSIELITPDAAKELLKRNPFNRKINPNKVAHYARQMSIGEWPLTHQGIALDEDDFVIDGQHRLSAVVQSGKSVLMRVTRGIPRNTQWAMDKGEPRRIGGEIDIQEMRDGIAAGARHGKEKQAIAVVLAAHIDGCFASTLGETNKTLGPFKDGVDFAVSHSKRVYAIAPVRAGIAVAYRAAPTKVSDFFLSYLSGANLSADSPALALRSVVELGQRGTNMRSDGRLKHKLFLCTCRAVEAHLDGDPLKIVRPTPASLATFLSLYGLKSSLLNS